MTLDGNDIPKLDPREVHFRIPGPNPKLKLFLRSLAAQSQVGAEPRPVLYVHGATFPSANSIAHRIDGVSWRDVLNNAGFDVWALEAVSKLQMGLEFQQIDGI